MASGTFWNKVAGRLGRMDAESAQAAVERLASAHGLLERVFHSLQEGVAVVDGRGTVAYANRGACRLLGAGEGGLEGHGLGEWIPEADWEEWVRAACGGAGGASRREVETGWPESRFLTVQIVPLDEGEEKGARPEGGSPDGGGGARAVVILRDVTGERRRTAERVESERLNAILLLAAEVAHEIGNPLNSMDIHLQLLQRETRRLPEGERESLGELVGVAREETARLGRVLSQFLKAVRSASPEFKRESLPDIVRETLSALKAEIGDRGILVEERAPEGELPAVWADRLQAGQACFNVVRNAIQAMSPGGILAISYAVTDRMAGVSFKDTGPGIPEGRMGELFDAFNTTRADGHGLGLLVVQRIMRDHGGSVEIDTSRGGTRIQLNFRREDRRMRLLEAGRNRDGGDAGGGTGGGGEGGGK